MPAVDVNLIVQLAGFVGSAGTVLWKMGQRDAALDERLKGITDAVTELRATVKEEARGVDSIRAQSIKHGEALATLLSDVSKLRDEFDAHEKLDQEERQDVAAKLAGIEARIMGIAEEVGALREARHDHANKLSTLLLKR